MFVSFTLTPALCAWWLKPEDAKADHSTTKSGGFYAKIDAVLRQDAGVVAAPSRRDDRHCRPSSSLSAAFLYPRVGKELVPDDDQGEFSVNVRLPRGTSYQRTEEFIKPIEKEVLGAAGAAAA